MVTVAIVVGVVIVDGCERTRTSRVTIISRMFSLKSSCGTPRVCYTGQPDKIKKFVKQPLRHHSSDETSLSFTVSLIKDTACSRTSYLCSKRRRCISTSCTSRPPPWWGRSPDLRSRWRRNLLSSKSLMSSNCSWSSLDISIGAFRWPLLPCTV